MDLPSSTGGAAKIVMADNMLKDNKENFSLILFDFQNKNVVYENVKCLHGAGIDMISVRRSILVFQTRNIADQFIYFRRDCSVVKSANAFLFVDQ